MNVSQLLPGDILIFGTEKRTVFDRIKRLVVRWSHVAMYIGNGDIVESVGRGVIVTGLVSNYAGREVAVVRYPPHKLRPNVGVLAARRAVEISRQKEAKYDFKTLTKGAIPRLLSQKIGVRPRWVFFHHQRHYICSELVLQTYNDIGVDLCCTNVDLVCIPVDFLNSPVLDTIYMGEV